MERELKRLLTDTGAALVGYADITGLPGAATRGYSRAVSIAVALAPAVVAGMPTGPHRDYSEEYDRRNAQLDAMGLMAEEYLKERGHGAWAVTRRRAAYEAPAYATALPHKTAARLAGHGWVGKCAVLVTPEYGGAVRLTTVLTNAPLPPGAPVAGRCGRCTACQAACPAGAVSGAEFDPAWAAGVPVEQARAALVDAAACSAAMERLAGGRPGLHAICGRCIAACPYTLAYLKRAFSR